MEKKLRIAIDGPAGAGKSTVAKIVADKLSYVYIDTGAMYRALTYKALQQDVNLHDEVALAALLRETKIALQITPHGQDVILDGQNVSAEIRSSAVTNNVSFVATPQTVREEMVDRQQQLAAAGGVVMDGRDIGTHVMPEAELKVFLIASVEERAKRRYDENMAKGFETDFEKLKEEISLRDKRDSEREFAPLKKADDALELDTTSMSIDEVVEAILRMVTERA
ncbi:cytidylate kinase [Fictibacillus macauensis ZFHKF-1]|uniref:Cytidylate kinase n=1 Tax=Fictibacillus macauensis ZFHKF-1 TaxID=1196324 RepID=I8J476_9BACL|nr:(d)CMP kinase [Fictibacillus macauensis]EIT86571.1 cytidylate kinase [Fictibacillus macauensis ZFHKF-1]